MPATKQTAPLPYHPLRQRAERLRNSIWQRAQAECRAAGVWDYGHLHNALVSADNGKPWREVDYSRARSAARLFERQFDAVRWLTRLYEKRGPSGFIWS